MANERQDDDAVKRVVADREPVVLRDGSEVYPLGQYIDVLEDAAGLWTYEDITSDDLAGQFRSSSSYSPNLGITDSAYWIRLQIRNEADESAEWLLKLDSTLGYVDAYVPNTDGGVDVTETGAERPYHTRDVDHPDYLFSLDLEPGAEKVIHLRIESEEALRLPLSILSAATLAQESIVDLAVDGIVFGMLLVMIGYNLILFVYLRESSYLYFSLFLLGSLVSFLWVSNLGHRFLWPNTGRLNAIAGQFSFMFSMIFTLLFTSSFLETKQRAPRFHRALQILAGIFALLLVVQYVDTRITARVGIPLVLVSYILILWVGTKVWRRGYRPARYFLLAWLLWLTSTLVYVLSIAGLIPLAIYAETGSAIGLLILILTLSLALIDRIRTIEDEREIAQAEVVRQQQETIQLIDEFAHTLQERVDERTAALVIARDEAELARVHESARRRAAEGLRDVIVALNSERPLPEMLGLIAERSRALLHADAVLLCSLDVDSQQLTPQVNQGLDNDGADGKPFVPDYAAVIEVIASETPTLIDDEYALPAVAPANFSSVLALPVSVEARWTAAAILLYYENVPAISADDAELASLFAAQAALAIESAELRRQAREAAVSSERDRIARDLHDSVTQALFSASLIAEALPGVWQRRPEMALDSLEELRSLTHGALAEMRSLLLELRPGELAHLAPG